MTTKLPAWIGRRASRMLPLVVATVLTLAACASPPAEPSVTMEITPDVAAVVVGGSRSFTASATGVSDASASWSLGDDCGSLQVESATRVTYTAPDDVPGAPCVLTAASLEVAGLTASVAIEVYDVPTLTFGADTAFARPFRSVTFNWSLGELPPGSSLRCDLHALGAGTPVTATFEACGDEDGTDGHVHAYETPGEYEALLVVYHDEERLLMGDWAIEVRNVLERISTGRNHSLAVDSMGNVVAWGKNGNGRLGDGSNTDRSVPIHVCRSGSDKECWTFDIGPSGSVSAGGYHSLALDSDGYVWAWGDNGQGQLGIGTSGAATGTTNPTPVCASGSGPDCVQLNLGQGGAISAGGEHSLALDGDGGVWAWGGNETGELGDGTMTESPIPNPVRVCATGAGPDCTPFVLASGGSIIAGEYVSLALSVGSDSDAEQGVVWSWGWNGRGVLGTGTIGDETSRANPGPVCASGSGASCVPLALGPRGAISAGEEHALASDTSGGVWSWGRNGDGQLGDGTTETRLNPVPVCAPNGDAACVPLVLGVGARVSAGRGSHSSFASSVDGELWAWGWNGNGQLGDGTTEARSVPVPVCAQGSGDACRRLTLGSSGTIAAGESHATALHGGGNAWAWGRNDVGQLGDGTTEDSSNPVAVSTPLWW